MSAAQTSNDIYPVGVRCLKYFNYFKYIFQYTVTISAQNIYKPPQYTSHWPQLTCCSTCPKPTYVMTRNRLDSGRAELSWQAAVHDGETRTLMDKVKHCSATEMRHHWQRHPCQQPQLSQSQQPVGGVAVLHQPITDRGQLTGGRASGQGNDVISAHLRVCSSGRGAADRPATGAICCLFTRGLRGEHVLAVTWKTTGKDFSSLLEQFQYYIIVMWIV